MSTRQALVDFIQPAQFFHWKKIFEPLGWRDLELTITDAGKLRLTGVQYAVRAKSVQKRTK